MAVTYSTTLKTNRMQLVSDLIATKTAAASTGSATAGWLSIGTSAMDGATSVTTGLLANIALGTAPFSISGAVATLAGTPLSATASATGTAAKAEFRKNANTTADIVVSGLTVGTSGTDIILNSVSITSGQTVTVNSGTITHG